MKAVNLIPDEQRRGAGGTSGRSGGVAYAVVGVLAGFVALVGVYATTASTMSSRKATLDSLTAQVTASQNETQQLSAYTEFAALSASRVATISQIADTRFPWAHALREIPRVLPKDVWLESMAGSVAPTQSAGGGGTGVAGEPAIDLQGCTTSQSEVAKLMTSLRLIDGVDQVNLSKSEKSDSASATAGSCTVKTSYPAFDITVSFKLPNGASSSPSTTTAAQNSPASALGTSSSSSAPAASTTPTPTPASGASGGGQG